MTKQFNIQLAKSADAPAITALCDQLGYKTDAADVMQRMQMIMMDPKQLLRVAMDREGDVIGWVHALPVCYLEAEPFIEIGGLVVEASCRKMGAGRALMTAVEDWARDEGYRFIRLRSNILRKEAHRFYATIGYQNVKQQYTFVKEL